MIEFKWQSNGRSNGIGRDRYWRYGWAIILSDVCSYWAAYLFQVGHGAAPPCSKRWCCGPLLCPRTTGQCEQTATTAVTSSLFQLFHKTLSQLFSNFQNIREKDLTHSMNKYLVTFLLVITHVYFKIWPSLFLPGAFFKFIDVSSFFRTSHKCSLGNTQGQGKMFTLLSWCILLVALDVCFRSASCWQPASRTSFTKLGSMCSLTLGRRNWVTYFFCELEFSLLLWHTCIHE